MTRTGAFLNQAAEGANYSMAPHAEDIDWQLQGNCRGGGDEFHSRVESEIRYAKRICADCPVIQACRGWALDKHEMYGVWGGLSESERADIWSGRPPRVRRPRRSLIA